MGTDHDALVALALEVDGAAAAVLLDLFEEIGRLSATARELVAPAWDLCSAPMSVLSRERWVRLFRAAGYTHEFAPAQRPTRTLRLYRGSDARGRLGMCWSTNLDVARWFAARQDEGWVWASDVEPWRLLAFMAAGYEDQYVVDTTDLEAVVVERPSTVAAMDPDALVRRLDAVAGAR